VPIREIAVLRSSIITEITLGQFGGIGTGNGQLDHPRGIALDSAGNIIVADWNNSVLKVRQHGNYLGQLEVMGRQQPIHYLRDVRSIVKDIYAADRDNYRIQKFTRTVIIK